MSVDMFWRVREITRKDEWNNRELEKLSRHNGQAKYDRPPRQRQRPSPAGKGRAADSSGNAPNHRSAAAMI